MALRASDVERPIDGHERFAIAGEADIAIVRKRVKEVAQELGFDAFATAAITTAASELARNVWTHASGGESRIERVIDGGRRGVRLEFRDQGPGIPDLQRVLAGGYSTARSLGLGLSGSRRLVDEFHIETTPGRGTLVRVTKWARF
jgi:serine/threonine-protein kinase RsbT